MQRKPFKDTLFSSLWFCVGLVAALIAFKPESISAKFISSETLMLSSARSFSQIKLTAPSRFSSSSTIEHSHQPKPTQLSADNTVQNGLGTLTPSKKIITGSLSEQFTRNASDQILRLSKGQSFSVKQNNVNATEKNLNLTKAVLLEPILSLSLLAVTTENGHTLISSFKRNSFAVTALIVTAVCFLCWLLFSVIFYQKKQRHTQPAKTKQTIFWPLL